MTVALIGSRKAPKLYRDMGTDIAMCLARQGIEMISGGAIGMDKAFEKGYTLTHNRYLCNIVLPTPTFGGYDLSHSNVTCIQDYPENIIRVCDRLIKEIHPYYDEIEKGSFAYWAHIRNCVQVLGLDLMSPVDEVFLWAPPNGIGVKGGTNTAFRIAQANGIPCWNLAKSEHIYYVEDRFGLKPNNLDFLL